MFFKKKKRQKEGPPVEPESFLTDDEATTQKPVEDAPVEVLDDMPTVEQEPAPPITFGPGQEVGQPAMDDYTLSDPVQEEDEIPEGQLGFDFETPPEEEDLTPLDLEAFESVEDIDYTTHGQVMEEAEPLPWEEEAEPLPWEEEATPEPEPEMRRVKKFLGLRPRVWVITALVALVIAAALRLFVIQVIPMGDQSMQNVAARGQGVLTVTVWTDLFAPQRGDLVIAALPGEGLTLRRVAALPGETVQIKGGTLYVDGRDVMLVPFVDMAGEDMAPARVPQDGYFLLCEEGEDSRSLGAIDKSALRGRAVAVVWPLSNLHWIA